MILKPAILLVLRSMGEAPTTDAALRMGIRMSFPNVIDSEISSAIKDVEANGYIAGVRNTLLDTITWSLTTKGQHAASQL